MVAQSAKLSMAIMIRIDAVSGTMQALVDDEILHGPSRLASTDLTANGIGMGRELFARFRAIAGPANEGASVF